MSFGKDLDDPFVKVWFNEGETTSAPEGLGDDFYGKWIEQASAKHISPELFGAHALRKLYPGYSLVMSSDQRINPLNFPGAYAVPIQDNQVVTNVVFVPLARRVGATPGLVVDFVQLGSFVVAWEKYEFIVHIAKWTLGFNTTLQYFILHDGPEEPARNLLLACGIWQNELHDEIWVFNQGFWNKDRGLWTEVQKADWKDVILHDEFKKSLQKDVYGFFSSEAVYKELAIPWKVRKL
jgi:transitional endoplasmic reticulum ATPase